MIDSGFLGDGGRPYRVRALGMREARGGAPLVLLHEGLGCVSMWRDWPAELARATGREVFAYSRFGYGRSSPAELPRPLDFMDREARAVLPGGDLAGGGRWGTGPRRAQ